MARLNDSFLVDLEDLSDNDADADADPGENTEQVDDEMVDLETLKFDDLDSVSKLQNTQRYKDIKHKVEHVLQTGKAANEAEYQMVVDCNGLTVDIDNEILIVKNFIVDKYKMKFPELESLVKHPIDYARVVQKIGNEMDLTLVDLKGVLPSADIMVVCITATTTTAKPLSDENLLKTLDACDRAIGLDATRAQILKYVMSRMECIAPNLSAIVGSEVAAKLMAIAGGLSSLANIPACNVQLLGVKKKILVGFSAANSLFRAGYIKQTEIVQSTPEALRLRACRLLAGKASLAVRVDLTRGDPTGKTGRDLRDTIRKKIEKWQEPPPAKHPKPLPVPDFEPKKKRGGRRLRKMKEKYAVSDMRKLANRMQFGVAEESSLGDGLGEGYGMLGQSGCGKLRVSAAKSKLVSKLGKRFREKSYGLSGATSGLTSSLAFTPVLGIELTNPNAHGARLEYGTRSTYFSETGTFSKVKKPRIF